MKKILLIHHSGVIGGAGVSLIHILRGLGSGSYIIFVLCPEYPSDIKNLLKNEECQIISSLSSPRIFAHYSGGTQNALSFKSLKNIITVIKDIKNIKQYIKEVDPDIVAVNSMTLFWIGKIAKKLNKKTVCFHRETYQRGLMGLRTNIIKRGLSKWFDKLAFISWNDFNETGRTKALKKVIYDRVNISEFLQYGKKEARELLGLDQDMKYVLYLGGMSNLKGSDIIMGAMRFVSDKNIKLVFINDTAEVKKPSLIQYNTLRDRLKFVLNKDITMRTLGIYFTENLADKVIFRARSSNPVFFYKACDLVVFPSTEPHQSRPIYEAGAARIPIIITDFPQTREFARNEVTVLTFKNRDCFDLASKINMVFKEGNKNIIARIVEDNFQQTVANHDLLTLERDLEELFRFD